MNDHDLQDLLVSAAPVTDEKIASARLGSTADAMRGAIMATTEIPTIEGARGAGQRRHRRRSTKAVVVATVAAVLIGGTAAAAVLVEARTGRFGMGGQTEDGTGEFIRLDASGAAEIVDELGKDIPLPPGGNFDRLKSTMLKADPDGHGVEMSESGIVGTLAFNAACQWTGYWLDGYERGDEKQKAEALAVLDEIPSWPALVASDGGGVVSQLRLRADAARQNNPSLFMQDYKINCTGELSPTAD